jgi:hypothetical protein
MRFLVCLFFSFGLLECVLVNKAASPLPDGDVEVTLSFQLEDTTEKVSDVTFHDSLPVHAELKDGALVGALKGVCSFFCVFTSPKRKISN